MPLLQQQLRIAFWLALSTLLAYSVVHAQQKGVNVGLQAPWPSTSYILEAAEFLSDEEPGLYWKYIDELARTLPVEPADVSACWQHVVVAAASGQLTPNVAKMLPLFVGARQYSARLEMYRQLAEQLYPTIFNTTCCWADIGGTVVSDPAGISSAIKTAVSKPSVHQPQTYEFDHILNSDYTKQNAAVAVLYGAPGTHCFKDMHEILEAAALNQPATSAPLTYVHRPLLAPACAVKGCIMLGTQSPALLPGWGVEAVLKNMEYSAMDDAKVESATDSASEGSGESLGAVKGFLLDALVARKPHLRQELLTFRDQLQSSDEEETVKVWDLKDIGLQAAQRVLSASDPLALLTEISQNFPSLVSSLSRQSVNPSLRRAVQHNHQYMSPGANFMLINGLAFDINGFDFYGLLERLRVEMRLQDALSTIQLPGTLIQEILSLRAHDVSEELGQARLDLASMEHVLFFNDLERDKQYTQRYSSQLSDILHTFPGRLRPLARNVFTTVFMVDPASKTGLQLAKAIEHLHSNLYPIRFGLAMAVPSVLERQAEMRSSPYAQQRKLSWMQMTASEHMARALLTMKASFGPPAALTMWAYAAHYTETYSLEESVQFAFQEAWKVAAQSATTAKQRKSAKTSDQDAWVMLTQGSGMAAEAGMMVSELSEWLHAKGLDAAAQEPILWMNGQLTVLHEVGGIEQELLYKVMEEQSRIQQWVYFGELEDDDEEEVIASILALTGSISRWNPRLLGMQSGVVALDLSAVASHEAASTLTPLFRQDGKPRVHATTHLLVVDLSTREGRQLLTEAVRYAAELSGSRDARIVLMVNPNDADAQPSLLDALVAVVVLMDATPSQKLHLFSKLTGDAALLERLADDVMHANLVELKIAEQYANESGLPEGVLMSRMTQLIGEGLQGPGAANIAALQYRRLQRRLAQEVLHLVPGQSAVISNGLLVSVHKPDGSHAPVVAEDFQLLHMRNTKHQPGTLIAQAVYAVAKSGALQGISGDLADNINVAKLDDVVMVAAAALASARYPESKLSPAASKQLQEVEKMLKGQAVEVGSKDEASTVHIVAILNPLTRPAQRISQVLMLLKSQLSPTMSLYLNPQRDVSDLPLKSYYRFALPDFSSAGSPPADPYVQFKRLPHNRVLTINLDVPESWLVEPTRADYDLDNLRLADVPASIVEAEFQLTALMLTGACVDTSGGDQRRTSPRGIQLHLGTPQQLHMVDTLVMANMAYFQLKAAPGRWLLSLAPGRARELYTLEASNGVSDGAAEQASVQSDGMSTEVIIASLSGKHMTLKVRKRPGKEKEDVLQATPTEENDSALAEPHASGGLWGSVASMFSSGKRKTDAPGLGYPNETINIFTVASGHMYERLQRIMMLSVVNNTKHPVKFWIISNYLSPHHRNVLPEMAKHFGFEYEFVTYKWPHWLHKQTEKQRIIWAYKILFLDVLFPLDVDRIIFVDSDQVVRADIAELYFMDIKNAPLAYTPLCDGNKEMDEYRFWKGGFWRDHLQGKPYHISALYLVDLHRFRQIAAGDNYRVVYEQLSKDPNSLANLDQDLPNYAQHSIPLFSLPQEWLWCESWCGNATKAQAKTIDLCNNPKTKEPKLSAARRIIDEWPKLDELQAEFVKSIARKQQAADMPLSMDRQPLLPLDSQQPDEGHSDTGATHSHTRHDDTEL